MLTLSPWGLAIAGATALVGGLIALAQHFENNRKAAKRLAEEHRQWIDSISNIDEASNRYSSNELTRLKALYKAATDETAARKNRISAAQQMQSLYPAIFSNFSNEAIMAGKAKSAYDQLTLSIIANAKARAAAELIQENEKKILDLEDEVRRNEAWSHNAGVRADNAREQQRQNNDRNSSQHAFMPAGVQTHGEQQLSETIRDNTKQQEIANGNIAKANGQIKDLRASNDRLAKIPGVSGLLAGGGANAKTPNISYTHGGGGVGTPPSSSPNNKDGKGGGNTPQNNEDDAIKKMAAEVAELTLKKNEDLTKLNDQYRKGELQSYDDYVDKQYNRTKQYYSDVLAVYKKYGQDQSKDAADVRTKQADDESKHDKEMIERKKRSLEQQRDADKMAAQMRYYEPDSEIFHNQQALDDELAKIDIEYLEKVRDLTVENTKERADAELALEKAKQAEILRQRKKLDSDLAAWLYIYSQQGAKQRMDAELAVVDELHKQTKLKTEEVEVAKAAIRKKYRDEVNSKTGTKAPNQDFTDAKDNYNKQLEALDDAHNQGLIKQDDYESRRWQIIQNYHNKIVELVKGEGNEWSTMVVTLVETWKAGFENLGSTIPEKMKAISAMAASAFAVMNAGIKSYTDYANASRDLEIAKSNEYYDKEIEKAKKNKTDTTKLEEDKKAAEAKIKTKYDKRAMAMEMAQAVASTAMAAINAYASAAAVPVIGHVLAPIAASMALAAGAVQIATIKKQHQVQQMGYYEGGFTGRDGNSRREVGVVHANEFVANHQAVANPELLPVLRLIDQAQRNNTVGSLTSEDVSRALRQGAILGNMTVAQQRNAVSTDVSRRLAASLDDYAKTMAELNRRLNEPFVTVNTVTGDAGIKAAQDEYTRLRNNTLPKRKRTIVDY